MEMRSLALTPDAVSYSTLLSSLCSAGYLDSALPFLPMMEEDRVKPDLVLYSTLMHLAMKLGDPSKAISLFSRMCSDGVTPDLRAFNFAISAYCSAGLMRDALRVLTHDMATVGVVPDSVSYSTLLSAFVKRGRFLAALSLFSQMRNSKVRPDLTTFNIVIHAYGQLGLTREADRLFWSMPQLGVHPGVVTYNTMLRVYGDAELFSEAIQLFRLMQKKGIEQNVITYNTMVAIYGKSLDHEKASNLVQEMQTRGIQPNAITYSTIISIWGKAGKLDRAAKLFHKLKESGVQIDPVLYQTMMVVYERAGLVNQARRLLHDLRHPENITKDTAIKILAKAGRVEEAAWVFRQAVKAGEVKEVSVYVLMIESFSQNRRHKNVIEVFDEMRDRGFFPDSETIATVLNAYGKLREFDKASALYSEMEEESCVFTDRVHFQMLSLLGMKGDLQGIKKLIEKLGKDPEIDKKELRLVADSVYEKADQLDEASGIYEQIRDADSLTYPMEGS
jgi:pentatricopeptide repeat protein